MKKIYKIFSIVLLIVISLVLSGCDLMGEEPEKKVTYTSVYPVEYVLDQLYGENLTIKSIYPDGQNFSSYDLTRKILNDYSSTAEFFVYNSIIEKEKDYAVSMINKNKSVKIIDASLGMPYINGIEETWLAPGNYLMMASNIKNGLKEYITETLETQKIEENFDKLKLDLSEIDAELKNVGSSGKTIIVCNDVFKYLQDYGFNVISIEENDNLTEKTIVEVRNLLANKSVKSIFIGNNSEKSELVKSLENDYGVQVVELNTLSTITSDERLDKKDYKSIMLDNINSIKLAINN